MNKLIISCIILLISVTRLYSQETANRFFYEFSFKPKKDSAKIDKNLMVLDILKNKSIYRDYLSVSQDSILKSSYEKMQKSGVYVNPSEILKNPKFTYKIQKQFPSLDVQFTDDIMNGLTPINIGYVENIKFLWQIKNEKKKIDTYNVQKALLHFGGRNWVAWFSSDLPFQDGPYKFNGLPGLIISIGDEDGNFLWTLTGNKKIENYVEKSYMETMFGSGESKITTKLKFNEAFDHFKKDPLGAMKAHYSPETLNKIVPGTDTKLGDFIDNQGADIKSLYESNNNSIEIEEK